MERSRRGRDDGRIKRSRPCSAFRTNDVDASRVPDRPGLRRQGGRPSPSQRHPAPLQSPGFQLGRLARLLAVQAGPLSNQPQVALSPATGCAVTSHRLRWLRCPTSRTGGWLVQAGQPAQLKPRCAVQPAAGCAAGTEPRLLVERRPDGSEYPPLRRLVSPAARSCAQARPRGWPGAGPRVRVLSGESSLAFAGGAPGGAIRCPPLAADSLGDRPRAGSSGERLPRSTPSRLVRGGAGRRRAVLRTTAPSPARTGPVRGERRQPFPHQRPACTLPALIPKDAATPNGSARGSRPRASAWPQRPQHEGQPAALNGGASHPLLPELERPGAGSPVTI